MRDRRQLAQPEGLQRQVAVRRRARVPAEPLLPAADWRRVELPMERPRPVAVRRR